MRFSKPCPNTIAAERKGEATEYVASPFFCSLHPVALAGGGMPLAFHICGEGGDGRHAFSAFCPHPNRRPPPAGHTSVCCTPCRQRPFPQIPRHPPPRPFRRRVPLPHDFAPVWREPYAPPSRRSVFKVFRQAFFQKGRCLAPQRPFFPDLRAPGAWRIAVTFEEDAPVCRAPVFSSARHAPAPQRLFFPVRRIPCVTAPPSAPTF